MSNFEVFSKLADYLLHKSRVNLSIAGIVYIHRAGDPIKSRAFVQNLGVLCDIFLGDPGLSRLTFMVVPKELGMHKPTSVVQSLSCATVFHAMENQGAKIVPSTLGLADIDDILESCASCDPILLRIQQESTRYSHTSIISRIEERLGRSEPELMKLHVDQRVEEHLTSWVEKTDLLEATVKDKESKLLESLSAHEQTIRQLTRCRKEALELRQQLGKTRSEYEALLSQLQLEDSVEEDEIVQALEGLNRSIGDVGRSISVYLVETYARKVSDKSICDITALDACHLPKLKMLLAHDDTKSSLVASSEGAGMPIEDFFDYSIRSLLCEHLYRKVLSPFHPTANSSQNDLMATMYKDIHLRASKAFANMKAKV
ncbi:hypothetical protein FRC08_013438 [Ceratobasidium sp. 394]|nr:hypothetical protein FRC08_013438 [Ceratobasidium sp. 394]